MKFGLIAATATAVMLAGAALAADGPGPVKTMPEFRDFSLGAIKLTAFKDADFVALNDGHTFGLDASPEAVAAALAKAGAPTDRVSLSINVLMARIPGHVVLLDTGLGPKARGGLLASLAKAGVKPEEVTDVLITHAHGDHIGGLLGPSGGLAFPNATIHISNHEWDVFRSSTAANAMVRTLTPKVQTFDPGAEVLPGINAMAIDGHTPGHVGYELSSGKTRLLDIGDTAHSSIISLAKPDWSMGFDANRAVANASRRATLTRLAESGELVYAPHFPFPGVGRIMKDGDGFAWKPGLR